MKITKSYLKQIIKEELSSLSEATETQDIANMAINIAAEEGIDINLAKQVASAQKIIDREKVNNKILPEKLKLYQQQFRNILNYLNLS